jgi:hypothetical protein
MYFPFYSFPELGRVLWDMVAAHDALSRLEGKYYTPLLSLQCAEA